MDKQCHVWFYMPHDVPVLTELTEIQKAFEGNDEIINIFQRSFGPLANVLKLGYRLFVHFNPYGVVEVITSIEEGGPNSSATQEMICYKFVD